MKSQYISLAVIVVAVTMVPAVVRGLTPCQEAWGAADVNQDGAIQDTEYVLFLNLLSDHSFGPSRFEDLPQSLQENFLLYEDQHQKGEQIAPWEDMVREFCCNTTGAVSHFIPISHQGHSRLPDMKTSINAAQLPCGVHPRSSNLETGPSPMPTKSSVHTNARPRSTWADDDRRRTKSRFLWSKSPALSSHVLRRRTQKTVELLSEDETSEIPKTVEARNLQSSPLPSSEPPSKSLRPSASETPSTHASWLPSQPPTKSIHPSWLPSQPPTRSVSPSHRPSWNTPQTNSPTQGTPKSRIPSLGVSPSSEFPTSTPTQSLSPSGSHTPTAKSIHPSVSIEPSFSSPHPHSHPSSNPSLADSSSPSNSIYPTSSAMTKGPSLSGIPSHSYAPTITMSMTPNVSESAGASSPSASFPPSLSNRPSFSSNPSWSSKPSRASSLAPSICPSASPTWISSLEPSQSHAPIVTSSAIPSIRESEKPSTFDPSGSFPPSLSTQPSFSRRPSISVKPSQSYAPITATSAFPSVSESGHPSTSPSPIASSLPSSSTQPSFSVSPTWSTAPSIVPSSLPSDETSSEPTLGISMSMAPSVSLSSGQGAISTGISRLGMIPTDLQRISMLPSTSLWDREVPLPSYHPSESPVASPSIRPSEAPSLQPSNSPTTVPSSVPSLAPTISSSHMPSTSPSTYPSQRPSASPSSEPSMSRPSVLPTTKSTLSSNIFAVPSLKSESVGSSAPSVSPYPSNTMMSTTLMPSQTLEPTRLVAANPSSAPTAGPSSIPSLEPSDTPSDDPSLDPSNSPSITASASPSSLPSRFPSSTPSDFPSLEPSATPTIAPSGKPSADPSFNPSASPSFLTSPPADDNESALSRSTPQSEPPSLAPPSAKPSSGPSYNPSAAPSLTPSQKPSGFPSTKPSSSPSYNPSVIPSVTESSQPSSTPSFVPSISSQEPTMNRGTTTSNPSLRPPGLATIAASNPPGIGKSNAPSSTRHSDQPSAQPWLIASYNPSRFPSLNLATSVSPSESFQPSIYSTPKPTSTSPSESSTPTTNAKSSEAPTRSFLPSHYPSSFMPTPTSENPSSNPSQNPSVSQANAPSDLPSLNPSAAPSVTITTSETPSQNPSTSPTSTSPLPSSVPSSDPSAQPSKFPSSNPSLFPSTDPSGAPSRTPSRAPAMATTTKTFTSNVFFHSGTSSPSTATSLPKGEDSQDQSEEPTVGSNNAQPTFPPVDILYAVDTPIYTSKDNALTLDETTLLYHRCASFFQASSKGEEVPKDLSNIISGATRDDIEAIKRLCTNTFGKHIMSRTSIQAPASEPSAIPANTTQGSDRNTSLASSPTSTGSVETEKPSTVPAKGPSNVSASSLPVGQGGNSTESMSNPARETTNATEQKPTNFTRPPSTTMPVSGLDGSDVVRVFNSFDTSNSLGLTASSLWSSPLYETLLQAYADFVSEVISNWTTQPTNGRRLGVMFAQETAEIYSLLDIACPSLSTKQSCIRAFGRNDLHVTGENTRSIYNEYVKISQLAIQNGVLQRKLQEINPASEVSILGTSLLPNPMSETTTPENDTPNSLVPPLNAMEPSQDPTLHVALICLSAFCGLVLLGLILWGSLVASRRRREEQKPSHDDADSTLDINEVLDESQKSHQTLESGTSLVGTIPSFNLKSSYSGSECTIEEEHIDAEVDDNRLSIGNDDAFQELLSNNLDPRRPPKEQLKNTGAASGSVRQRLMKELTAKLAIRRSMKSQAFVEPEPNTKRKDSSTPLGANQTLSSYSATPQEQDARKFASASDHRPQARQTSLLAGLHLPSLFHPEIIDTTHLDVPRHHTDESSMNYETPSKTRNQNSQPSLVTSLRPLHEHLNLRGPNVDETTYPSSPSTNAMSSSVVKGGYSGATDRLSRVLRSSHLSDKDKQSSPGRGVVDTDSLHQSQTGDQSSMNWGTSSSEAHRNERHAKKKGRLSWVQRGSQWIRLVVSGSLESSSVFDLSESEYDSDSEDTTNDEDEPNVRWEFHGDKWIRVIDLS